MNIFEKKDLLLDNNNEQSFISWFGEKVPCRHGALYREEYRPFYIKTTVGSVIEFISSSEQNTWKKNDQGDYEIPKGGIFKFGPYIYKAVNRNDKVNCYNCDLGYHCSCTGVNCGFNRSDKKQIGYKRIIVNPKKLESYKIEWKFGTWKLQLFPESITFGNWPKNGCVISFLLYIHSAVNNKYWILWDENTGEYWSFTEFIETGVIPIHINDFIIKDKSFKDDLDKCLHKELDKRGFNRRKGTIKSLDEYPLTMELVNELPEKH